MICDTRVADSAVLKGRRLKRIHVNQHVIKRNRTEGQRNPPLTVKVAKGNVRASELEIVVDDKVVATIVYRPDKPLDCGAHVWIETRAEVRQR